MQPDYPQQMWDDELFAETQHLAELALREDVGDWCDATTVALVPASARAAANVVLRQAGTVCGLECIAPVIRAFGADIKVHFFAKDGDSPPARTVLARLEGSARDLLTAERTMLNFLGRLSGIASLTAKFVQAVHGLPVRLYDTRKTIPGYRKLEKYAVRCGGGHNHRENLASAILIKDNHLALGAQPGLAGGYSPAQAVQVARAFAKQAGKRLPVEVEVDSLKQLALVLPEQPDIVLLDNMSLPQLAEAVQMRNAVSQGVELEASGGVTLATVRSIAETGVDRISTGAVTHSAINQDVALDWV